MATNKPSKLTRGLLHAICLISGIAFLGVFAPLVYGPFPGWLWVFCIGLFGPVVFLLACMLLHPRVRL